MASDLFEDGLLKTDLRRQNKPAASASLDPAGADPGEAAMARQKEDLTTKAAVAVKEIETLRQRQRDLEHEKETIERLTKRQDSYQDGKREMISRLSHALVAIRKEQEEVTRTAELLEATRIRFEKAMEELREINEQKWPEREFAIKVEEALAVVEGARATYDKCQARLDAVSWLRQSVVAQNDSPVERLAERIQKRPAFLHWLGVGFAVTLPLAVVVVVLYLVHFLIKPLV
jgi:predicted nuclease with TOPRIM domain